MPDRLGRLVAAGVLAAALGLGAGACGSGAAPASSGAGSSASPTASLPSAVPAGIAATIQNASQQDRAAFAQCMRKNGLPNFPSDMTLAALHAAGITIRSSSFLTAARACYPDLAK